MLTYLTIRAPRLKLFVSRQGHKGPLQELEEIARLGAYLLVIQKKILQNERLGAKFHGKIPQNNSLLYALDHNEVVFKIAKQRCTNILQN